MGAFATAINSVLRDYVTDAVPATGPNQPDKAAFRAALGMLDTAILGPATSRKGNVAFYNNTTGKLLAADLAFNSGNPGNSALYSQLANPADGYVLPYNGLQISIGDPIGSGEQLGQGATGVQQSIVGTVQTSATDTGNAYGVMGYAKGNSAATNVIGVGGWGAVNHTNGNAWGGNFICHNMQPVIANGGFATNWMSPIECDMNVWKGPAGAEMAHTNLFGIYIHGGGDSTTNQGTGVGLERLSVTTNAKWNNGFASRSGAAINAFVAGPAAFGGVNLNSQYSIWQAVNGGGSTIVSRIWSDSGGDFIFQVPSAGLHSFQDADGNIFLSLNNAIGGAGVQFNKLSGSPGLIIAGSTGVLSSITTGANVQTALGIAIGSAGSILTNGSAGTLASLKINGATGAGFLDIAPQASGIVAPAAGFVRMGMDSSSRVFYIRPNGKSYTLDDTLNTSSNRIYTLPDVDGKVALEARLGTMSTSVAGVNFNSANTDTALAVALPAGYTRFAVHRIVISNPSASLTTSTFGFFTTTAAGGAAIVPSNSANIISTTADNTANNSQAATPVLAISFKASTLPTPNVLYFRVQTAQGAPATADVTLYYQPLL
jgi:hypothetical protein